MADLVRIVTPKSGSAIGTKVFLADGAEIKNITGIKISPLDLDSHVTAEITLLIGECDIHAHPLLSLESLRAAAYAHGYRLEHGTVTLDKPTVKHT